MSSSLDETMKQIEHLNYNSDLREAGAVRVIEWAEVFDGKQVWVKKSVMGQVPAQRRRFVPRSTPTRFGLGTPLLLHRPADGPASTSPSGFRVDGKIMREASLSFLRIM